MEENIEKIIKKYALQNSLKFSGSANPSAVLGKVLGEDPSQKVNSKELIPVIQKVIQEISKIPLEDQKKMLEELAPELLEKKQEKERNIFSGLSLSDSDIINTGFPPGPEKYPHIGHAKAILLNYILAKQYHGKFILRFEDTNPQIVKQIYYDVMLNNFSWLDVKWDELVYASDYLDLFYEKAEYLIKKGLAYVDFSSQEEIQKMRETKCATRYRDSPVEENLTNWKKMSTSKAGDCILRLKIDLNHQNSTMRDPTIFRIVDEKHPRQPEKRVWPNYDFQNAIMDSYNKIDLRLRSKEFEMRSELQRWIQLNLDMTVTKTYEFGRFNMTGVVSSGRVIREMIEKNELIGWDDPSLTTLVALKRRGFLPEAIKNFVVSTGISKAEATMTWDDLIMHNRRLLDNSAKRYSAIFDPVQVTVKNAPPMNIEMHLNPNEKKGGRKLFVETEYIISKKDNQKLIENEVYRFMDAINFKKTNEELQFDSIEYDGKKTKNVFSWLPNEGNIYIEVLMPDKSIISGLAEHNISNLAISEIIQFEKFGFVRLDGIEKNNNKLIYRFWFTHR